MSKYKVTLALNYNDIFLEVTISGNNIISTRELAEKIGESGEVVLMNNRINILNDFINPIDIKDEEKDLYQFQICKKEIKPVDISKLSAKEILDLMDNEDYMTCKDDYVDVDWNISEVYKILKEQYPEKSKFRFDSLAYGIEAVER
ncbi:MAG: hypothetical protein RSA57_03810 [Cetobacterium sp.]|uniref:hypothetical protein n=1 Tax=Bacteria TaxID=2 RepID=UPI002FC7B33B